MPVKKYKNFMIISQISKNESFSPFFVPYGKVKYIEESENLKRKNDLQKSAKRLIIN